METKANYVLIGAFVLLAAGALALFALWIAGNPLNRSFADYDVIFEGPVNGLTEGGEVTVVLTRTHARRLEIVEGTRVWLTASSGATTVPAMVAV